ncbi:hypothetical protein ACFQS1_20285 [Paractinoplanes rhizophilus]|uniref:Uncharacterized protein n=1 Tax=Paractinoplanes rhizophilus TaxID=1416877 RepID=A0ABW2HT36_9ACTN
MYVVDCATGEVLYLSRIDMSVSYVSASPRQFAECLRVFASEVTAGADDPDDPGFWVNVLFDVANGDYSEQDD